MSTEARAVLAQVDMLAGIIEAACLAILRARVTGPLADVDTAETMAKLRMAKRLATEGASMLRMQVSIHEGWKPCPPTDRRMAEELAAAKEEASQQATRAEAAEMELREMNKRTT